MTNKFMDKRRIISLIILVPLTIIVLFIAYSYIYLKFRKISYFKCSDKPNADLLQGILNKYNFIIRNGDYSFHMPCGYNFVEDELDEIDLPKAKYVFALKNCDNIVSKNELWNVLEKRFGRKNASKIMPESFLIDNLQQINMALSRIKNKNILICKKNLQRKLGLKLIFNENDFEEAVNDEFTVAQVFLLNTMQIKGRKMNLRIYYLIKKVGNKLEFFVNTNGKVLYTKEKTSGKIKFESHITSFQMDPDLYERENIPHNFRELQIYLGNDNYFTIWKKILHKLKMFSWAIAPEFEYDKFKDKVSFQLFGMDVIIDGNEPFILEVNKGPDMIPKCRKDQPLKEAIYEEMFQIVGLIYRPFKKNNFIKIYDYEY